MLRRWYSTVAGLRNSCAATSRLVSPSATRRAIWASWDVSALVVSTLRVPAPFTDPLGGLLQPGRVPGQLPGKTGYQHFALRSATSWAGPVAVAGGIAVINDPVADGILRRTRKRCCTGRSATGRCRAAADQC